MHEKMGYESWMLLLALLIRMLVLVEMIHVHVVVGNDTSTVMELGSSDMLYEIILLIALVGVLVFMAFFVVSLFNSILR